MYPDYAVRRPAVLPAVSTACAALGISTNGLNNDVMCWDRRQPQGQQLYAVQSSSKASSVVAVGDSRICFMAEVSGSTGMEIACADLSDAGSMPPTAEVLHDTNPGSDHGQLRCEDGDVHAHDDQTVCWWAATSWSASRSGCEAAVLHCHNFTSGVMTNQTSETWTNLEQGYVRNYHDPARGLVYFEGHTMSNQYKSKLVAFDVGTGSIEMAQIGTNAATHSDSIADVIVVPGVGVVFSGHDAVRPTNKKEVFFWTGRAADSPSAFDGTDTAVNRGFSDEFHHIEQTAGGGTDIYITMFNADSATDGLAMVVKVSVDAGGAATWSKAPFTAGGAMAAVLPGAGTGGGPGFILYHQRD